MPSLRQKYRESARSQIARQTRTERGDAAVRRITFSNFSRYLQSTTKALIQMGPSLRQVCRESPTLRIARQMRTERAEAAVRRNGPLFKLQPVHSSKHHTDVNTDLKLKIAGIQDSDVMPPHQLQDLKMKGDWLFEGFDSVRSNSKGSKQTVTKGPRSLLQHLMRMLAEIAVRHPVMTRL